MVRTSRLLFDEGMSVPWDLQRQPCGFEENDAYTPPPKNRRGRRPREKPPAALESPQQFHPDCQSTALRKADSPRGAARWPLACPIPQERKPSAAVPEQDAGGIQADAA